jgi:transcriptional regulator with XRE-family HTH domain
MSDRAGRPDPRLQAFGVRLRLLRERRELTIEQLADSAGVSVRQITRVEAGRASPSLLWVMDVAAGLRTTAADLIADDIG